MTDQQILDAARKITVEIMKERSLSGEKKPRTLVEWEILIRDALLCARGAGQRL